MKKIKVLWFSRHAMTKEQRVSLGDVEIFQVNKTIQSAYELQKEIEDCDIIAVEAPIGLQEQFLRLAGGKPVIMAVNDRRIIKQEDGSEDKVEFHFVKWERLLKIEVVKENFPNQTPIENCGFSVRTYNCLKRAIIDKISDIESIEQLMMVRDLGQNSLKEIVNKLSEYGIKLPESAVKG